MSRLHALLTLLLTISASAQDLASLEKVLIPVLNASQPILGANGSRFESTFGLLTASPIACYPAGNSSAIGQIESFAPFLWEAAVVAKGRFIFVEPGRKDVTWFASLTSFDGQGHTAVTPLPVIRENQALTGQSSYGYLHNDVIYGPPVANHPTLAGYRQRHTLRIYDFDSTDELEVTVRLRLIGIGVYAERRIQVKTRDFDHPSYPYYAELNLEQVFGTQWRHPGNIDAVPYTFDAILEVEPTSPTARYYAFVSTTDNDTNHVAIYTPR